MTHIDLSSISRTVPAQNTYHQAVDSTATVTNNALSIVNDQLNGKIEELTRRLFQIENFIKDQNQKIEQKDQKILDLETSIKELSGKSNKASNTISDLQVKDQILFIFSDTSTRSLIYRTHGFKRSSGPGIAGEAEVMIEFKPNFPKEFTLDIKGHIPSFGSDGIENGIFEVHIGKLEEKRHKEEFQLVQEGWGKDYTRDYASVSFKTEDEDNNTIWINLPKAPYDEKYEEYKKVGMKLYSLNIIPREK
ncbi:hypothetical protein KMZ15_05750 [Mycoavidus sp. HKI]|uniref:hypothetical protein n=1 Tax=Mycoavidus sp. HKI TaxID=2840467 RepID=UPI001CBCE0F4|nr:hypothetical protein [Mycoavidus sp. HKI]UAW63594.1 hypothetical protein KMZ15_05750 [Mycoavidus sp. HKI]